MLINKKNPFNADKSYTISHIKKKIQRSMMHANITTHLSINCLYHNDMHKKNAIYKRNDKNSLFLFIVLHFECYSIAIINLQTNERV